MAEFEQAVRIDPEYADGWVGLAYAHETAYINGGERAKHCPRAHEAVESRSSLARTLATPTRSAPSTLSHASGTNQRPKDHFSGRWS